MTNKPANPLIVGIDQLPATSVALPTGGYFYDDTVLEAGTDVADAMVRPFTMWQEVHFNDFYSVTSGHAHIQLINQCAPWVIKPDELCQPDIEVIMLAAREASYGPKMKMRLKCQNPGTKKGEGLNGEEIEVPTCGANINVEVDIREAILQYEPIADLDDWKTVIKMGKSEWTVLLRPKLYKDTIQIIKLAGEQFKIAAAMQKKDQSELDLDAKTSEKLLKIKDAIRLLSFLASIRGVIPKGGDVIYDRNLIEEWLNVLPKSLIETIETKSKSLLEKYDKAALFDTKCPECGHEMKDISIMNDPNHFFGHGSPE